MKPSPSKKFRSGSSFSRRGGPSGNSCITYQPSVSGEHKAQVTTKAEVEPGQRQGWGSHVIGHSFPSFWVLICLGPLLSIPVQEKPHYYIIFSVFSPPHFFFFFIYWFSSPFFFSRRPLRSSWCFTSDSTFGENKWGLDYSWPLLFTCSWRDFANVIYKVGSLSPFSVISLSSGPWELA